MTEGLGEVSRLTALAEQLEDRPVRRRLTSARVEYGMWSDESVSLVLEDVDQPLAAGAAQHDRVLSLLPPSGVVARHAGRPFRCDGGLGAR